MASTTAIRSPAARQSSVRPFVPQDGGAFTASIVLAEPLVSAVASLGQWGIGLLSVVLGLLRVRRVGRT
jgi:hypothetical protein